MPEERQQFRVLYRDFLSRMIDLELIAAGGDARKLIARIGAILGALSFMLAYLMVPRYATSGHSHARLTELAWSDEEFLISTTIAVAGLCAVLAWNNVFPDRRDSLILGLMPVRMRTMMLARIAAVATVLGSAIAILNVCTGLSFPFALATGFTNAIGAVLSWWLVVAAAGIFVFCGCLAVQGITSQILPWRLFLRISGPMQLLALSIVLAFFFLTPPFTLVDPPTFIPSFWFVGLLHEIRGDGNPVFGSFATRALIGLGISVAAAMAAYVLSWHRNVRRIVESPEILPAIHARFGNYLARLIAPRPFERAILLFSARTLARSRQHRLMLAIYGGFGFALSLAFSASLLQGRTRGSWNRPGMPLLIAGLLLLVCALVGIRAIFALPMVLPANWTFRITAVHRPADYFAAVRKSLFAVAALPVLTLATIFYLVIWPGRPALEHIFVLSLVAIVIGERSLNQFRKIPFTCSWLPGGTNRGMKAAILGMVFLVFANWAAAIELWTLERPARLAILISILAALAFYARRRAAAFAANPDNRLQFEDTPPAEIFALDLRQDGTWSGDEAYVEAIDPHQGRSLFARLRPLGVTALLLLVSGAVYERVGEWRDRRRFPQVGQSVDIQGRSLNVDCIGAGTPAIVFETGYGTPGLEWAPMQQAVSQFTRACWYDRAGLGWSDSAPHLNTSAAGARDLHELLRIAGISPPFVLVGHSTGGLRAWAYRKLYPDEVAGMLLVDSPQDGVDSDIPDWARRMLVRTIQAVGTVGGIRLIMPATSTVDQMLRYQPKAIASLWNEISEPAGVEHTRGVGNSPVFEVSTGGLPLPLSVGTISGGIRKIMSDRR